MMKKYMLYKHTGVCLDGYGDSIFDGWLPMEYYSLSEALKARDKMASDDNSFHYSVHSVNLEQDGKYA